MKPTDIEPRTCYYTGGPHCGDCRDPATNESKGCFDAECYMCMDTGWITIMDLKRFEVMYEECPDCEHLRTGVE